jgi:hypothetical protein
MGIYSHLSESELSALRDKFTQSLTERLTGVTVHANADKRVQWGENSVDQIRAALAEINAEIDKRAGRNQRRPIYLV